MYRDLRMSAIFVRGHSSETCRRTYLSVHCRFIYYEQICVIKKGTNSNGKNETSKMSSDFNKLNKNVFTDKTQKKCQTWESLTLILGTGLTFGH